MEPFEYKAFISYSWANAKWGNWVHRALESYRTPKALIGQETPLGPVPRSLHPLFKDREEEAAGASIGAAVETALAASEFLLVICSPQSAKSEWVNFEIAWFKTHRDPSKILALIVDGEPGASKIPGREAEECFPRALTHEVDENLQVTDVEADTPLAADARPSGDGKQNAKLKLAAAMLGVKLDELVRRDQKRRAVRGRIAIGASLSLAAVMSGMAWFAIQARNEAQVQCNQAEGLVEFMISDLRENLQPNVQLQVLGGIADRANDYYDVRSSCVKDGNALGRRARVLELLAELELDRGNSEKSLELFRKSVEASAQQLTFDPDNPQRILEHAYSVQGLGNAAFQQGELQFALTQMASAVDLLGKLAERSDATDEWVAEYGSALANLGVVHLQQRNLADAEGYLQRAVEIKREASGRPDAEWQDRFDLARTLAWMARAQAANGKDAEAATFLDEESAIYSDMLNEDPEDTYALAARVANRGRRAQALLDAGKRREALIMAEQTAEDANRSLQFDPDDLTNVDRYVRSQLVLGRAELATGNISGARAAAERAATRAEQLAAADPSRGSWTGELLGNARVLALQVTASGAGSPSVCMQTLRPIAQEASRLAQLAHSNENALNITLASVRAALLYGELQMLEGAPEQAGQTWRDAKALLMDAAGEGGPRDFASISAIEQLDARLSARATGAEGTTVSACGL